MVTPILTNKKRQTKNSDHADCFAHFYNTKPTVMFMQIRLKNGYKRWPGSNDDLRIQKQSSLAAAWVRSQELRWCLKERECHLGWQYRQGKLGRGCSHRLLTDSPKSINQSFNQSINQSTTQPATGSQPANWPTNQPINQYKKWKMVHVYHPILNSPSAQLFRKL